jgi:hypothetical protein
MLLTRTSERQGRVIDHDAAASMEKKKQEGYFWLAANVRGKAPLLAKALARPAPQMAKRTSVPINNTAISSMIRNFHLIAKEKLSPRLLRIDESA